MPTRTIYINDAIWARLENEKSKSGVVNGALAQHYGLEADLPLAAGAVTGVRELTREPVESYSYAPAPVALDLTGLQTREVSRGN